ncbi:MAG: hypothetical protein L0210_02715 [Rhodospirillales bacterium]|nr:hypothetical protein [Rhodospirillales bacterium]
MSPMAISWIVFGCTFGGALLGMYLRTVLPEHHLNAESKDLVKLCMGVVATMSALVLSLLIASAKSSYDAQRNGIEKLSTNITLLDRVLALYGPETKDARYVLRRVVGRTIELIWPQDGSKPADLIPKTRSADQFFEKLQAIRPHDDNQRALKAQAISLSAEIAQTRWLMFQQLSSSIPGPFMAILVFWLMILFASFGLTSPANITVIAAFQQLDQRSMPALSSHERRVEPIRPVSQYFPSNTPRCPDGRDLRMRRLVATLMM